MSLNDLIKDSIATGTPRAFGKIGETEAQFLLGNRPVESLHIHTGVFPPEAAGAWATVYLQAIGCLDGAVAWQPSGVDARMLVEHNGHASVSTRIEDLLPLASLDSWHRALGGKRVLVVHPMVHTISYQKSQYSSIWPGASLGILTLIQAPYPPMVSGKAEYLNWFDAFHTMSFNISRYEFDIAIVGAGAYSLPLLHFIKTALGKPCVHLGGRLQLLFGILGRRWDKDPTAKREGYGQHGRWIRPLDIDVPKNAHLVEKGCYW